MSLISLIKELKKIANSDKALILSRFFKTGRGQYGENDKFLGLTVPQQRAIAQRYYQNLSLFDIKKLLAEPYHEMRLTGALILVAKYQQARQTNNQTEQKIIFSFYFNNSTAFNNWDLVDLTAEKIMGDYLLNQPKHQVNQLLNQLAQANNLWSRRISMVATYAFIKNNKFDQTIRLAEILLNDQHDLIHKAVGWMLREVGKRNKKILLNFLNKHLKQMPRTTLRYAIEKFSETLRQKYLKNN